MRLHYFLLTAALTALTTCNYWLHLESWRQLVAGGAGVLALACGIAIVSQPPAGVSRKRAALVLPGTIVFVFLLFWLSPIARLRIAFSSHALAEAAASGSLRYDPPKRIGLFSVKGVWITDGVATFAIDESPHERGEEHYEGWHTMLRASIGSTEAGVPRLTDWSWESGIE